MITSLTSVFSRSKLFSATVVFCLLFNHFVKFREERLFLICHVINHLA